MITAIGIAGSPRRNGNSATLLESALEGARSAGATAAMIRLDELSYGGCRACEVCAPRGECTLVDGLTPVFAALRLADIWILASPIYRDGLSGQFKSFFDRLSCWEGRNRLAGTRRAAMIVTYEAREREDYRRVADTVPFYLAWMGDFGDVKVLVGPELKGPTDASTRTDLLERAAAVGRELVEEARFAAVPR